MIGNDIIDLNQAKFPDSKRFKRYASKICADEEIAQFACFEQPLQSLWRFWSLKEAAYKAALRMCLVDSFSPIQTQVSLLDAHSSIVSINSTGFSGFSIVESDHIYSEVSLEGLPSTRCIVEMKDASELISRITKVDKLPFFQNDGIDKVASITHHGQYFGLLYLS